MGQPGKGGEMEPIRGTESEGSLWESVIQGQLAPRPGRGHREAFIRGAKTYTNRTIFVLGYWYCRHIRHCGHII